MTDQQLSEHFRLSEFVKKGDEPTNVEIGHLRLLCTFLLEPIRRAWCDEIMVTSGYRSAARNATIKNASKTSAHILGYAADIKPVYQSIKDFKPWIKEFLKDPIPIHYFGGAELNGTYTLAFDQCIDERNAQGSEWVHIGLMNAQGEQRRQFLITTDGKTYKTDKV